MLLLRRFVLGVLLVLVSGILSAQTPEIVLAAKFRGFRQISATAHEEIGAGFGAQIQFANSVPAGAAVQLRAPSGALTALTRNSAFEYEIMREFSSVTALNAAFPDGTYTLMVGGTASVTVPVSLSAALAPVLITNYTELQAAPPITEIRWQPIPRALSEDLLSVTITDPNGREVFSTPEGYSGGQTMAVANSLPTGVPLTGELFYAKVSVNFINGGATAIASAAGFAVEFPLRRIDLPPTILESPRSRVARVGESVSLVGRAANASTYRWKRNGVVLPQHADPTLWLYNVQGSDAGSYSFEAVNSSGLSAASESAVLLVQPEMTVSTFAGQASRVGSDDGPVGTATFREVGQMTYGAGALYVIDKNAIRKIAGGVVTTLAGSSLEPGYVDGPGSVARFNQPLGIAVDIRGNVFVSDTFNARLRKITPEGVVSTLPAPAHTYRGLVIDARGDFYVRTESDVLHVTQAGVATTLYRGPALSLMSNSALPIALDALGDILVSYNSDILKISRAGVVTPFVTGRSGSGKSGGLLGDISLAYVSALAVDSAGFIYVASGVKVWMIAPSLATAAVAEPYSLNSMALDPNGTLYGAQGSYSTTIVRGLVTRHSTDANVRIVASPQSQAVATGDAAALQVAATGPDLSYQWFRNGVIIPGAAAATLVVRNVTQAAEYTAVVGNGIGTMRSVAAQVSPLTTSNPGRLINLSLRARAGAGAQTLIMGFALGGAEEGSGERTLLLRGIGPSLSAFGVSGVLTDPRLQLLDTAGRSWASNDNWGGDRATSETAAAVGAFPLANDSRDAALLVTLPPRAFTAQILGPGEASGVALVEVYDAPRAADRGNVRLVNVSARTVAGAGDDTLTAGLVIGGSTPKTVLLRAVGRTLGLFGITDFLPNPKLTLYSGQTKLAENDDWGPTLTSDVFDIVGAFALGYQDSALVVTLPPGAYSMQVTGLPEPGGNTTSATSGVALVEVYEIK